MAIIRMTRAEYLRHNPGVESGDPTARQQAAEELLLSPDDVEQMARDLGLSLPSWFEDWKRGPWVTTQMDGIILDDHPNTHKFGAVPATQRKAHVKSKGIRSRLRKRS